MRCDKVAQVHAYHDGELPAADRAAVEAHVAACEPCAAMLDELRSLTRLLAEVPLPAEADAAPVSRYYGAFYKARGLQQRGVLRLSGWLTAAAAVVLAVSLFRAPPEPVRNVEASSATAAALPAWQPAAVMPVADQEDGRAGNELVVVARWMAEDLAAGE